MFKKWLSENRVEDFDFSAPLFPPACDRRFWESKKVDYFIEFAETHMGFDWPIIKATDYMAYIKEASRVAQENPYFARRKALLALVVAELFEYKGRFLPDILNGIFAICEETYWGLSAHKPPVSGSYNIPEADIGYIDLYAAETGEILSLAYYFLYDEFNEFCPEILERIEYETERRIIIPYLHHADFWWMGYTERKINNWNPWIISNVLTTFLIMEKRKTYLNRGIVKMMSEIQNYYDAIPEDGGCDEGFGYWNAAGARVFDFCEQLYNSTKGKINLFGDEKFQKMGKYAVFSHIDKNYFVNFADGHTFQSRPDLSGMLYLFGKRIEDESLMCLSKFFIPDWKNVNYGRYRYQMKYLLYSFINREKIEKLPEISHDKKYFLPDLQCSFMRNGKWFYAAKAGHNHESHNHNDVGSFIAYYDGNPVLIDVGCLIYNQKTFSPQRYEIWCMQSDWHNLPVINGVSQKDGWQYKANNFSVKEKATEISFISAYDEGTSCKDVTRKIEFSENGITVEDDFSFTKENNTVSEHFITDKDVVIKDNTAIIGGEFVLDCGDECEISVKAAELDGLLTSQWKTDTLKQICFNFEAENHKIIKFNLRRIEK